MKLTNILTILFSSVTVCFSDYTSHCISVNSADMVDELPTMLS